MFKKLASLTTIAKEFFTRRETRFSTQRAGAASSLKSFYRMIAVGQSLDEAGGWEVDFFLSGSAKNPHAFCPLSPRKLGEMLQKHLGSDAPQPEKFDRNHFILHAPDRQKARQLARRLVHIFQSEGILPMADEMHRFKPEAPKR